jgi:hypothetical protein
MILTSWGVGEVFSRQPSSLRPTTLVGGVVFTTFSRLVGRAGMDLAWNSLASWGIPLGRWSQHGEDWVQSEVSPRRIGHAISRPLHFVCYFVVLFSRLLINI